MYNNGLVLRWPFMLNSPITDSRVSLFKIAFLKLLECHNVLWRCNLKLFFLSLVNSEQMMFTILKKRPSHNKDQNIKYRQHSTSDMFRWYARFANSIAVESAKKHWNLYCSFTWFGKIIEDICAHKAAWEMVGKCNEMVFLNATRDLRNFNPGLTRTAEGDELFSQYAEAMNQVECWSGKSILLWVYKDLC